MARITKAIERKFFLPNDPDKAWTMIKHLSPGETQDIFDKVFTQEINYKKVKEKKAKDKFEPEFSQKTDKSLDRELTLTTAITDWGGFFGLDGKKLQCTPKNIMDASREIDGFIEHVADSREELAKEIKEEKEDQIKNSLKSASDPAR